MGGRHILIIGAGSVGKRHARNLASLGCRVSCTDPREDRRAEMAGEVALVAGFADEKQALAAGSYDGVVIGSPPNMHVPQAIAALEAGLPVLLEKPAAPTAAAAKTLAAAVDKASAPLLMGYTWRWWPPLAGVRKRLADKENGDVLHVQFHMSAHLADWHPWEPYQEFFMSRRELGGGALLDESHWIDLMLWLFGVPAKVSGRIEKISPLEIDSDDNVDLAFVYESGPRVTMHLDLYGRPHEKFIRFVGTEGTLFWSADPNETRLAHGWKQEWQTESHSCERNDMFVAVAREFLDVVGGKPVTTCTMADGLKVLEVIEAARKASDTGCTVELGR